MGLIRILIIATLVYLSWRLIQKTLLSNNSPEDATDSRNQSAEKNGEEKMVQCQQCKLHLPEAEAIHHQQLFFCSEEHKRLYLQHADD